VTAAGYRPFQPARRPSGRPAAKPRYRVLVHRKFADLWASLPERVRLAAAQQFYDHVANTPGQPAAVNRTGVLRGRAGEPMAAGFSRTIHYEISGAGRIDYQFHDTYRGARGDPHPVVFIRAINPVQPLTAAAGWPAPRAHGFGAQFAEVRVHEDSGEIRVPRLASVFAADGS
jgi:CO/xanthine dehydrogenase Mo-binding subunit